MVKKIILVASVLLCIFSINVLALQVDNAFYVYGQDDEKLSNTIGMTEGELKEYCESNGITFLAVDKKNKRQIRKAEIKDAFSEKIENFLALKESEIIELTDELTGFTDVKGTVIDKADKRYLRVEVKATDSGGEYILTQYITVADSTKQILSFYTDVNTSGDYIEEVFASQFKASDTANKLTVISIIGTVLFSALALVVTAAIIKDTFTKKPTE